MRPLLSWPMSAPGQVWYEANAAAGRDLMALGAAVLVFALVLPSVVELPDDLYAAACASLLFVGSMIMTVRGWRLANRLLRQRLGKSQ